MLPAFETGDWLEKTNTSWHCWQVQWRDSNPKRTTQSSHEALQESSCSSWLHSEVHEWPLRKSTPQCPHINWGIRPSVSSTFTSAWASNIEQDWGGEQVKLWQKDTHGASEHEDNRYWWIRWVLGAKNHIKSSGKTIWKSWNYYGL